MVQSAAPEFGRTARVALAAASREARRRHAREVGTDDLLLGLAAAIGSDSARALELLGISEAHVRERFARERRRGDGNTPPVTYSDLAALVVRGALSEADSRGDRKATSGDLLLSLARQRVSPGGRFLSRLGVTAETVAAALARAAEPVDIAADPSSSPPQLISPADGGPTAATWTSVSVQCSHIVNALPDRTWELVSSPEAWSLSPRGGTMVEVPDTDGLRLYVGPVLGWPQATTWCLLLEPESRPATREITLSARTRPAGLFFTASVHAALAADWAEIRVAAAMPVHDGSERSVAARLREDLDGWLKAMGRTLAGEASWPSAGAPPQLVAEWAAEPVMEQPRSATAAVLIEASPEVVWNLIRRPWASHVDAGAPAAYSGRIPGTPVGEPGETWYNIHRHDDGALRAAVMAITQYTDGRLVVRRDIACWPRWPLRRSYRLTADADGTRLEVEYRWPAAAILSRQQSVTAIPDHLRQLASQYKAAAESGSSADDDVTGEA